MSPPRDPRANHPGFEGDSVPPAREILGVKLPHKRSDPASVKMHGHSWTPANTVNVIVVLVGLLGGGAGLKELFGASDKIDQLAAKVEAQSVEIAKIASDKGSRDKSQDDRIILTSELLAKINGQKPHFTWPTPRDGAWTLPTTLQPFASTGHKTEQVWPE